MTDQGYAGTVEKMNAKRLKLRCTLQTYLCNEGILAKLANSRRQPMSSNDQT